MRHHSIPIRNRQTVDAEEDADRRAGAALRLLRMASRMGVAEVAHRANIHPEEWADHEAGTMPIPVTRVPAIAMALQLETGELLRLLMPADLRFPHF